MLVEMSKTKRVLAVIAIMATAIAVMSDLVFTPVYGLIYGAYPEYIGLVNYFVSGPMLVLVVASLLTGILLKRINKKVVMIAGGVVFAVGALFGNLFLDNLLYMCIMRTLVGIGAGVTNVVALALISDLYEDISQRAKITGYYNAALSVVGTVFSYFGGLLAANGVWDNVFKLYWSAIPMVILLILFIPSIKPVNTDAQNVIDKNEKKQPIGWRFWWMSFTFFLFNIIMGGTVLYFLSPFVFENNIGGPEFVGLAAGIKSIIGFLVCLGFGFIYTKLKRNTISVMYLIAAVTMLILITFPSANTVLILATICAITYKIAMPYAYAHGTSIVPSSRISECVAIVTATYGMGSFLSTYYATWLMSAMKSDTFTKTWYVNVVILGVMFVAEIIVSNIEKKKHGVKSPC